MEIVVYSAQSVQRLAAEIATAITERMTKASRKGKPDRAALDDLKLIGYIAKSASLYSAEERKEVMTYLTLLA